MLYYYHIPFVQRNLSHFDALTVLARLSFNRTISGTRWTALTRQWRLTDVWVRRGAFNQLPFKFHAAPNSLHQYPHAFHAFHPTWCSPDIPQVPTPFPRRLPSYFLVTTPSTAFTLLHPLSLSLCLRADIESINKARDGYTRELHELLIPRWTYMSGES